MRKQDLQQIKKAVARKESKDKPFNVATRVVREIEVDSNGKHWVYEDQLFTDSELEEWKKEEEKKHGDLIIFRMVILSKQDQGLL